MTDMTSPTLDLLRCYPMPSRGPLPKVLGCPGWVLKTTGRSSHGIGEVFHDEGGRTDSPSETCLSGRSFNGKTRLEDRCRFFSSRFLHEVQEVFTKIRCCRWKLCGFLQYGDISGMIRRHLFVCSHACICVCWLSITPPLIFGALLRLGPACAA